MEKVDLVTLVNHFRYLDAPTDFSDRLPLGHEDLGLATVVDDLPDAEPLPRYLPSLLLARPRCPRFLTQHLGPVKGGRSVHCVLLRETFPPVVTRRQASPNSGRSRRTSRQVTSFGQNGE